MLRHPLTWRSDPLADAILTAPAARWLSGAPPSRAAGAVRPPLTWAAPGLRSRLRPLTAAGAKP